MAPSKRRVNSNKDKDTTTLPGNMKFKGESGDSLDSMEKKMKSNNVGDIMRIGENEEFTVAILKNPEPSDNWPAMYEHTLQPKGGNWTYLPCTDKCPACTKMPDNSPRLYAYIPLYVYEIGRVQFFRAPSTIWNDIIAKYKRGKARFLSNKYILSRHDDSGPTRYEFDRQDEKVGLGVKKAKIPDINAAMSERWTRAINQLGWKVTGEKFEESDDEGAFDHSADDDLDIDDVKDMDKKQLMTVIEDYELDIEDPEDFKTGALKKLVIKGLKELDEEDDE